MAVRISGTAKGSPASKLNIPEGASILSINGEPIDDVLDYGFYSSARSMDIVIAFPDGEEKTFHVDKREYDDLGFESETFLMDEEHSCRNKCIFCFIDQNPKGLRRSLYFKDDDMRLSFLFGSYVTLTNITDHDIDRVLKMKISPINISVHTLDPELRKKMMCNRFAGDSLRHLYRLTEAGADINCQIVCCPGWNDGESLRMTLEKLVEMCPSVGSVAVIPVGLTKFREGLTPLKTFDREGAKAVLDMIRPIAARCREKWGDSIVYASDEFYLLAGEKLPGPDEYGDYRQIENGVGMIAQFTDEFASALDLEDGDEEDRYADCVTGFAAADTISGLCEKAREKFPNLHVRVHVIRNDFFGPSITVAGLLTATDILNQVKKEDIRGNCLIGTEAMLRRDGDRFLDDVTKDEFEERLGLPLRTTTDGADFLDSLLGR